MGVRFALLACVLVALASSAAATSPTLPVVARASLQGEPAVGVAVSLELRFSMQESRAVDIRLHASPGIDILDDPAFRLDPTAGEAQHHSWRLMAAQEGFWSLALSATVDGEPYGIGGPCCGYGWSGQDAGAWAERPEEPFDALPAPEGTGRVTVETTPQGAHVEYTVDKAHWLANAQLTPQLGQGTVSRGVAARAISMEGQVWEQDFDLAVGEEVLAYAMALYALPFPAPEGLPQSAHTFTEHSLHGELDCQNLRIARDSAGARLDDSWACNAAANRVRGVPAPEAASLVAALGGVVLRRRRRA